MSQNSSRKKTQYERGHEAAEGLLQDYVSILRPYVKDGLMFEMRATAKHLLAIAWQRGYDAARRDARKGSK